MTLQLYNTVLLVVFRQVYVLAYRGRNTILVMTKLGEQSTQKVLARERLGNATYDKYGMNRTPTSRPIDCPALS